jgi:hypothetical protein
MSSCNNKRNFKRRRNGRSHSVFSIWNRDKHRGESAAFKFKLKRLTLTAFSKCNGNYREYGFHSGQRLTFKRNESFASCPPPSRKLTKAPSIPGSSIDGNCEDISKLLSPLSPPSLLPSPISPNWCQSQTHLLPPSQADPQHQDVRERTEELELMLKSIPPLPLLTPNRVVSTLCQHQRLLPSNVRPPLPRCKVASVAQLIRLLSLILKVTCISHYCSKLFSSSPFSSSLSRNYLPTFDLDLTKRKSGASPSSCAGGGGGRRAKPISCTSGSKSASVRMKKSSRATLSRGTFTSNNRRVRCQISSVRSDFIYIIVFGLFILCPRVAPVITSNEVYPMDAASNGVVEAGKLKLIDQLLDIVLFCPPHSIPTLACLTKR